MTMPETTMNDNGMRRSLAVSTGVHIVLLIALIVGLPHLMPPLPPSHATLPFEIVEIADITTTKETPPPPTPEVKPTPEPPKPAEAKPEQTTPTPPPPDPKPQAEAEAIKPVPMPKPKPPPPDTRQQTEDFTKLLKNLENVKKPAQAVPAQPTETKPVPQSRAPAAPVSAMELRTLQDAIRSQVEHCWNMPIGARDAQNLVVVVGMDVGDDGTVTATDIVDKGRYASDPFFRAAADAAVRAVHDPRCSPLKLPAEQYDVWRHINFTFDPRDML